MLFQFKFFLILMICLSSINVFARDIVLLTYKEKDFAYAKIAYDILTQKMNIPRRLVRIQEQQVPCRFRSALAIQVCLNQKKDIEIVHRNDDVMKLSLNPFWEGIKL